ncbi:MAG: Electron transport complex subunit RsxB [Gammaproteobacteria bacterium]|nr:Electron transport complex subunit RsxB [Gammaproteobacteria bacterium]
MAVASAKPAPRAVARPQNVLIVGVGGQGVIMVSKVLASLCQLQGYDVKQSQVHGMAKRGGTVFSHVRYGERVYSPTIPEGEADVLVALEWAEGMRWLPYLEQKNGTVFVDTQQIVPPFACRNRHRGAVGGYVRETVADIMAHVPNSFALDALGIATALGVPKASNSVLLGAMSTALEFPPDDWKEIIERFVPPKTVQANLKCFDSGRDWALSFDRDGLLEKHAESAPLTVETPREKPDDLSHIDIEANWCKGCDICVRFCPERCLVMNDQQIAEVAYPERCTGCRICEWLCPDFAITVKTPGAVA